jgi:hypothetical protein
MAIAMGQQARKTDLKELRIVLKRVFAIMLTVMVLTSVVGFRSVVAQSQLDSLAAKVRGDVLKMGVGEKAGVEVKLRDSSKLKGYIGETTEDSFTLIDSKNGSDQRIAYANVEKVKKAGGGFSTRSWIILGAAVAGAVATWLMVKPALCDGGAQTRGPC